MPTLEEQRDRALAALRLHAQPDVPPTLGDTDLGKLVDQARLAQVWTTSTAYAYGDQVMPTVGNGRRYRCAKSGTSGGSEPAWGTEPSATVSDGTVTWEEDGPAFASAYDLDFALHLAWLEKAAKASALFASGAAQMQQVQAQCLAMADRFRPARVR